MNRYSLTQPQRHRGTEAIFSAGAHSHNSANRRIYGDTNDDVHQAHHAPLIVLALCGGAEVIIQKGASLSLHMKFKITITGPRVHDVGYRPWLTEKAVDLALRGFEVYNDAEGDRQSVVALVDSDERRATRFFEFAKAELPPLARVDDIRSEPYDEEIQPLWQSATLGTFMQIKKAVRILQDMGEDLREVKKNTNLIPKIAENTRIIPKSQRSKI